MPVFSHRLFSLAVTAVTYLRDFLPPPRPRAIRATPNKNRQGKTHGSDSGHVPR